MFAAPLSLSQIVKRDGIEVVVGEQNEPEAEPAQLFTSWITALAIRFPRSRRNSVSDTRALSGTDPHI
jgi:hypothetical protein